jgi:formylglycine-generating enzyme required for sulfatase activity
MKPLWVVSLVALAACGKADSSSAASPGGAGNVFETLDPPSGGKLVKLPGGEFTMGDASGRPDEAPHAVVVSGFWIDHAPVTQAEYTKSMGKNPAKKNEPELPAVRIQWVDAAKYCNKCSELENLTPCYDPKTWDCHFEANGYRLPTEAEWEYACQGGLSASPKSGEALKAVAWFKENSQGVIHRSGTMCGNGFGLWDTLGNVWQWCNDWYSESYYKESPKVNPHGPAQGEQRVMRGGAWDQPAEKVRAGYRGKDFQVFTDACFGMDSYGFRRVRALGGQVPSTAGSVSVTVHSTPEPEKKPEAKPATGPAVQAAGKVDISGLKGSIVFASDRSGVLNLWIMKATGKDQRPLTKDTNPTADPRFSPDGKKILYTTLRGGFPEVWVMNRDGSDPKKVTSGSQGSWSPDGGAIVFIRDNQGFVRDLGSGKETRVTPEKWERCGVPAWSPDGSRIALASRHTGNVGIYFVSKDGKDLGALKTEDASCTPFWSKDGKRLLCQTVSGHVFQLTAEGKDWEQMTFGADMQHDGRYSPDGTHLLFCRAPSPEGPWQICVKPVDGDDFAFAALTSEGSNTLPDWHPSEN